MSHIEVPIVHVVPDELHAKATNLVTIQHTDDEFVMSFFDVHTPAILGKIDENSDVIVSLKENGVRAICFARISIAASRMPEVVRVMQENVENWRKEHAEGQE